MRSFVHSAGRALLALLIFFSINAHSTEYEYQPAFYHEYDWGEIAKWSGIATVAILGITQLDKSEIVFASAYGFSGIYYLHENTNNDEKFEFEDYILPLGLATMALVNLTLLKNEDESKSSVFWLNMLGTGLLSTYWYYFEGPGTRASVVLPWTDGDHVGLAYHFSF